MSDALREGDSKGDPQATPQAAPRDACAVSAAPQASPQAAPQASPSPVNVDAWLAIDRYEVDEEQAHIVLAADPAHEEFAKLVRLCPAALYRFNEEGRPSFDYAGCLECGSCRIACGDTIIQQWRYPAASKGVQYRFG
ncbi:MAG: hypothetical protein LBO07_01405 [Coriobacteriales bacterium]|jgi:ferredoxin-like protein FixX|nr:hypothetical protein [Coriobacteriales bacterium]